MPTKLISLLVSSVAATSAAAVADPILGEFLSWAKKHGKGYLDDKPELERRFGVWKSNMATIDAHNAAGQSWTMAMNQFGDLTSEEFKQRVSRPRPERPQTGKKFEGNATATSVDWRAKGAVTPVRNQGECGSCWTFSSAAALEGTTFVAKGVLYDLSEQQLLDCDTKQNEGCDGGLEAWAYHDYVEPNNGLCLEEDYPYTGKPQTCKDKKCKPVAPISGFTEVAAGEDNLKAALEQHPVAVGVQADDRLWQFYASGVADGPCGVKIDHGVTAVGFGDTGTQSYWIIKNSWGTEWGEGGFIRLAAAGHGKTYHGKKGQCGVSFEPVFPIPK